MHVKLVTIKDLQDAIKYTYFHQVIAILYTVLLPMITLRSI